MENNKPIAQKDEINSDHYSVDTVKAMIKATVSKMGPNVSMEEKKKHASVLMKIFAEGMTPKDAMKISDIELAQIYGYAYYLFNAGKYKEAIEAFKMLFTLQPTDPNFPLSLGVCYHKQKEYEKATHCYILAGMMSETDPLPYFYAYDCFLNQNQNLFGALAMLTEVIKRAGDQTKYANIKQRALLLLPQVEKLILEGKK